jgi:hypothetical protein
MGRAKRVAVKLLPDVEWVVVPVPDAGPQQRVLRTRLGEWAKMGWYMLRGWI